MRTSSKSLKRQGRKFYCSNPCQGHSDSSHLASTKPVQITKPCGPKTNTNDQPFVHVENYDDDNGGGGNDDDDDEWPDVSENVSDTCLDQHHTYMCVPYRSGHAVQTSLFPLSRQTKYRAFSTTITATISSRRCRRYSSMFALFLLASETA